LRERTVPTVHEEEGPSLGEEQTLTRGGRGFKILSCHEDRMRFERRSRYKRLKKELKPICRLEFVVSAGNFTLISLNSTSIYSFL
jgi:hypothetical protein